MRDDRFGSDLTRPGKIKLTPAKLTLIRFAAAFFGLLAGLYYFIPQYGNYGVALTMFFALLAGIYLMRYQNLRREEKKK